MDVGDMAVEVERPRQRLWWSSGQHAGLWYPISRVWTWPKLLDFSGEKIHGMPSFGGEVKPSIPCRRFAACKRTLRFTWKLQSEGKTDCPFLAQFRPSLTEVSHGAWRGAPLEMTDGTKGDAQRASSLRPRCLGEVDPETATHISLSIFPPIFR
jgi:hypothetical protein